MSEEKKLPDKLSDNFPVMTKTQSEILDLAKQYNVLPIGDPKRKVIYEKIEDLVEYDKNWD